MPEELGMGVACLFGWPEDGSPSGATPGWSQDTTRLRLRAGSARRPCAPGGGTGADAAFRW